MNNRNLKVEAFVEKFMSEISEFVESQKRYSRDSSKTMKEWVEDFLFFSGYAEESEDLRFTEDDDDYGYDDMFYIDDIVDRKKYRSWRDDEGF